MDQHAVTYQAEAGELLVELELALLELEEKPEDQDLIGRVFRAMHTIKGSGAMFGFDEVAAFTHEVETVFDLVRSGRIPVTRNLIDSTLAARDLIARMVDREPVTETQSEALIDDFRRMLPPDDGPSQPEAVSERPAPVPPSSSPAGAGRTYRIRIRPEPTILHSGTNPMLLLDELRSLGESQVVAHTRDLPDLDQFDPTHCHLSWDVILTTAADDNTIKDVFIFCEDECQLLIEEIDDQDNLSDPETYKRLGQILVERGDVSAEDLKRVIAERKRIGEALIDEQVVDRTAVESALAEQQHVQAQRQKRRQDALTSTLRVDADKLDGLVDLVGELVTVQASLTQKAARESDPELLFISEQVERLTADLRDNAMSIRMLPIGSTFSRFKRLVRDLSAELGKEAALVTSGGETELDKTVIERLGDPLVHIIRNSIDHGLESPDRRRSQGKPAEGTIELAAVHSGAHVLIRITDDGAGLDAEAIRTKAVDRGLLAPDETISDAELYQLIFAPGFSTAQTVTDVSGRGVGMDVVKRTIESLRGTIEVDSRPGQGTTVTLKLPLTLAIIDGLLVMIDEDHFILPLSVVEECVELTEEDLARSTGRRTVTVRGELVPYIRLRERFGLDTIRPPIEQVVIGQFNSTRMGFVVDRVLGDHQTVIKSLGPFYRQVRDLSGATILGDGRVALVVDLQKLTDGTVAAV
jgi:two-component system chemotaxis sensor kinase CheA